MAEAYDLMNFSTEFENEENVAPVQCEGREDQPPGLVQPSVVVNSILKQSTKDNLIQLYTPIQKNKGRLKVHFGTPRVIQTPQVGNGKKAGTAEHNGTDGMTCLIETPVGQNTVDEGVIGDEEDRETWAERTSVLTKQDHAEYCQMARDVLEELVLTLPVKDDADVSNSDSGILEDSAMEVCDDDDVDASEPTAEKETAQTDNSFSYSLDILAQAEQLLRSLQSETATSDDPQPVFGGPSSDNTTSEPDTVEPMDVEEAMEIDECSMIQVESLQDISDVGKTEIQTDSSCGGESIHEADAVASIQSDDGVPVTTGNLATKHVSMENGAENVESEQLEQVNKVAENSSMNVLKPEASDVTDTKEKPDKSLSVLSVQDFDEMKLPVQTGTDEDVTLGKTDDAEIVLKSAAVENKVPEQTASKLDGGNSSDEEFMSADEEMDVDAKTPNKQKENMCELDDKNNVEAQESPERIPPKVGYNLNFDDLDALDPFSTKASVMNSPGNITNTAKPNKKKKPLKKAKTDNATKVPDTDASNQNLGNNKKQVDSNMFPGESPSKLFANTVILSPNAVLVDEAVKDKTAGDVFAEKFDGLEDNLQQDLETEDLEEGKLKQRLFNDDDLDPFKPKTQIVNSPAIESIKSSDISEQIGEQHSTSDAAPLAEALPEPVKENNTQDDAAVTDDNTPQSIPSPALPRQKAGGYDLDSLGLDSMDPFKPKTQVTNSPDVKKDAIGVADVDPFNPKSQIMNSPEVKHHDCSDPIQPKQQIKNSPVIKQDDLDLDPFKPKKQMMNSPDMKTDDINPFMSKVKVMNSPESGDDGSQRQSKTVETELDAFQPVETEIDAFVTMVTDTPNRKSSECVAGSDITDDPFKAISQIANSPPVTKELHSNTNTSTENDMEAANLSNNKSTESKIKTDADIFGDIDPFKAKKQVACSPVSVPVVNAGKVAISTSAFDDIDPFKRKAQIANSPVVTQLEFTDSSGAENRESSKQCQQSQEKPIDKSEVLTNEPSDLFEGFTNIDPFMTTCQMANSPAVTSAKVEELNVKSGAGNQSSAVDVVDPFELKTDIPTSPDGAGTGDDLNDVLEVQGITRRGATTAGAAERDLQGLDIDDSQFVPASQVFNDPGVWEMLEKFGNAPANESQESALSRMSLYVKFDPLVEESSAPVNPRRISIRPKQLEMLKEIGLDETLLLLGTPPKRKRQSTSVSHLNFGERRKDGGHAQPGAVDILLSLSPDTRKVDDVNKTPQKSTRSLMEDEETGSGDGLFEELKYTDSDVRKLRANWKMEYQGHVMSKDREWYEKEERWRKQVVDLKKVIHEQREDKEKMGTACNMYEELVLQVSAEKDTAIKQTAKVRQELDQAVKDEKSVESAFSDLHRRYEKLKAIVEGFKKNEDILKAALTEALEKQKKAMETLKELKKTAEKKISAVGQECEKLKHQKDTEHDKQAAQMKILTLNLEQKTEQNKQLTEICDNLLATAGQ